MGAVKEFYQNVIDEAEKQYTPKHWEFNEKLDDFIQESMKKYSFEVIATVILRVVHKILLYGR